MFAAMQTDIKIIELTTVNKPIILDLLHNKKALHILRAINHSFRLQLLAFIANKKLVMVTEIYHYFKVEQAIASQHLAVLRRAKFVATIKKGRNVYYCLNEEKLNTFTDYINALIKNW